MIEQIVSIRDVRSILHVCETVKKGHNRGTKKHEKLSHAAAAAAAAAAGEIRADGQRANRSATDLSGFSEHDHSVLR